LSERRAAQPHLSQLASAGAVHMHRRPKPRDPRTRYRVRTGQLSLPAFFRGNFNVAFTDYGQVVDVETHARQLHVQRHSHHVALQPSHVRAGRTWGASAPSRQGTRKRNAKAVSTHLLESYRAHFARALAVDDAVILREESRATGIRHVLQRWYTLHLHRASKHAGIVAHEARHERLAQHLETELRDWNSVFFFLSQPRAAPRRASARRFPPRWCRQPRPRSRW